MILGFPIEFWKLIGEIIFIAIPALIAGIILLLIWIACCFWVFDKILSWIFTKLRLKKQYDKIIKKMFKTKS